MKKLRIQWLKRRLRREYLVYVRILDEYDCGAALAAYMSPRIRAAEASMNTTLAQLKQLSGNAVGETSLQQKPLKTELLIKLAWLLLGVGAISALCAFAWLLSHAI